MKVSDAIAQMTVAEGVDSVFALMGHGNMGFIAALKDTATKVFQVRHESMAVAMAHSYYDATGRMAMASTTCGPGLTQAATSLLSASRHRVPLVMLAGDTSLPGKAMGGLQDLDQQSFVQACGAIFHPLRAPHTVADDVQRAFQLARLERRPVVLNAAIDVQESHCSDHFSYVPSTRMFRADPMHPSSSAITAAADILQRSERPLVIAGMGARSTPQESIEHFAETCGALLATTLPNKGWFDGSPYELGIAGGLATELANEFFAEVDCVIAIGCSLSAETTNAGELFRRAKYIQIDSDSHALVSQSQTADCLVIADAALAVAALEAELGSRKYRSIGFRTPQAVAKLAGDTRLDVLIRSPANIEPGVVDPRELMLILDHELPSDCLIVAPSGYAFIWPIRILHGNRRRQFLFPTLGFGSIGQGIGHAIGAAVARPDLPVVMIDGDASLLMNAQELDTIARYGLHILLVVLNDQALGSEYHSMPAKGSDPELSVIPTPDLGQVARAFGLEGGLVTSATEAPALLRRFLDEKNRGCLIDARISRSMTWPH